MTRVAVSSDLLRWARDRAGKNADELRQRFPKLDEWERDEVQPTVRQLEQYAKATRTPFGYFFLDAPPDESLNVPQYRTVKQEAPNRPSPELIDVVETMQRRQAWLRQVLIDDGEPALEFVGSVQTTDSAESVASKIRSVLGLAESWVAHKANWSIALQTLREAMDGAGIMVSVSGIVGNNTHRKLDVDEFRGFVLVDAYAPAVFVNGSDAKAAQMFTLAHELAHLLFGKSAIFDLAGLQPADDETERACNAAAAEFLVPASALKESWTSLAQLDDLAKKFKVSAVVIARRALDLQLISKTAFFQFYAAHTQAFLAQQESKESGGNFYHTQNVRLGRRFAVAVVEAVRSGRLAFRDAYSLTGLSGATFDKYVDSLSAKAAS